MTLFPFLSVLLSTMGILSFLAVTFLLFTPQDLPPEQPREPMEVQWVGAPEHARPLLVECRENTVRFHGAPGEPGRTYPVDRIREEVDVVKELESQGRQRLGPEVDRYQLWVLFKNRIEEEGRLRNSFTRTLHRVELDNLRGRDLERPETHYPVLLVYPEGIETYDMVSYLIERTTRLSMGVEPMLEGWELPYRDAAS